MDYMQSSSLPNKKASNINILIVDDEALCVMYLSSLLEDEGYSVRIAGSADKAIETLEHFSPDVAILDVMFPGEISGGQLGRMLREKFPDIVIIYSTGLPAEQVNEELYRCSPLAVLQKPVQLEELLTKIRNAYG